MTMLVGVARHEGREMPFIEVNVVLPPVPLLHVRRLHDGQMQVRILVGHTDEDAHFLFSRGAGSFHILAETTLSPHDARDFLTRLLTEGACLVASGRTLVRIQAFVVDMGTGTLFLS